MGSRIQQHGTLLLVNEELLYLRVSELNLFSNFISTLAKFSPVELNSLVPSRSLRT